MWAADENLARGRLACSDAIPIMSGPDGNPYGFCLLLFENFPLEMGKIRRRFFESVVQVVLEKIINEFRARWVIHRCAILSRSQGWLSSLRFWLSVARCGSPGASQYTSPNIYRGFENVMFWKYSSTVRHTQFGTTPYHHWRKCDFPKQWAHADGNTLVRHTELRHVKREYACGVLGGVPVHHRVLFRGRFSSWIMYLKRFWTFLNGLWRSWIFLHVLEWSWTFLNDLAHSWIFLDVLEWS